MFTQGLPLIQPPPVPIRLPEPCHQQRGRRRQHYPRQKTGVPFTHALSLSRARTRPLFLPLSISPSPHLSPPLSLISIPLSFSIFFFPDISLLRFNMTDFLTEFVANMQSFSLMLSVSLCFLSLFFSLLSHTFPV